MFLQAMEANCCTVHVFDLSPSGSPRAAAATNKSGPFPGGGVLTAVPMLSSFSAQCKVYEGCIGASYLGRYFHLELAQ